MNIRRKAFALQHLQNVAEKLAEVALYRPKGNKLTLTRDIVYDIDGGKRALFDIIRDKAEVGVTPLMIYIHGGGWVSGYRAVRRYYCYEYAEEGFTVINCDYEYAHIKRHPYQINQIFRLLTYLFDNQNRLKIDMNRIVIAGDSAGAHIAAIVTAIISNKLYREMNIADEDKLSQINVVASLFICGAFNISTLTGNALFGIQYFLEIYTGKSLNEIVSGEDYDLNYYMRGNYPPVFIVKAINDPLKCESDAFERYLMSNEFIVESYLAEGYIGNHCFALLCRSKRGKECLDCALNFVKKYGLGNYSDIKE